MRILPPGSRRRRQARILSLRWQRRMVFVLGDSVAALLPGAPAQALVVPPMLASVIGFATSRLVCPEVVYHALSHNFVAAGHTPRPGTDEALATRGGLPA